MQHPPSILKVRVPAPQFRLSEALARTAALTGRSQGAIALEVLAAQVGRRRMAPMEYFCQGAWIGGPDDRAACLGLRASFRINRSLIGRGAHNQSALLRDKYLSGLILQANGFPVPRIRAAFATDRPFRDVPLLETAEALAAWIGNPANLPAFGKPVDGTMALGSVPLLAADAPGMVDIGTAVVATGALAAEVARTYPRGWLLQDLIRQPAEVEVLIGPGVGTVRVVTLWEVGGPQLFYAVWRHPGSGFWVDEALQGEEITGCALDPATGAVLRAQQGNHHVGREVTHSAVSPDQPLIGYRIPDWDGMVTTCREAHRLFPGHALLGWDVAISQAGPMICEVNALPWHTSYQRAFRLGFLHRDHLARMDAARSLLAARLARYAGTAA